MDFLTPDFVHFRGVIDEVHVYDRPLTAKEATAPATSHRLLVPPTLVPVIVRSCARRSGRPSDTQKGDRKDEKQPKRYSSDLRAFKNDRSPGSHHAVPYEG